MLRAYAAAERLGRDAGLTDWYYPALNRLACEVALATAQAPGRPAKAWRAPERWAAVQQALVAKTRDDPDFFSVVGLTEWRLLQAIAQGSLSLACAGSVAEFDALHARVPSVAKWKSVRDQLDFVLAGVLVHGALAERRAAGALIGHVETFLNDPR